METVVIGKIDVPEIWAIPQHRLPGVRDLVAGAEIEILQIWAICQERQTVVGDLRAEAENAVL